MMLNTSLVFDRIRRRELIEGSITIVTLIEFPPRIEYAGFSGDVIFPTMNDYLMAYEIQRSLLHSSLRFPFNSTSRNMLVSFRYILNNPRGPKIYNFVLQF